MNTTEGTTAERVAAGLDGIPHEVIESRDGMLTLRCDVEKVIEVLSALRDRCAFEISTFVTAIDYGIEREDAGQPRFDMAWQFQSMTHSDRVRVHAWAAGSEPSVPSIIDLWPGATYGERECYDMFGIQFEGHKGLKRLLMPEAYDHFPLRKDFPHQGIEPDRLYRAWDRERRQSTGEDA